MERELLEEFDALARRRGYASRSEALRGLVRQELVAAEWREPDSEVVGTVTLVYEHHEHELANTLAELQHRYHDAILCSTHVHLDPHNCLEVVILRGPSHQVRAIADALISIKSVKHGKLVCSTTGQAIT
jgi:CopG family nickel-responsive transcriptional regulator